MLQYLVLIGAVVQLYGVALYIRSIIQGGAKPNQVTWLMWSLAPLIATFAALSDGVRWAVLPVFMSGFGPFLVFVSTLFVRESYWRLGFFDYLCGSFSLLALILWGVTDNPVVAIIFSIIADGFAAVPTLRKAWTNPETETAAPYVTGLISIFTSFAAITAWQFSQVAFPVYLVGVNSSLLFSIYRKRIFTHF